LLLMSTCASDLNSHGIPLCFERKKNLFQILRVNAIF
jgi:hypothetical protein